MGSTKPRILVFQHIAAEHPGIFRDFLAADGIAWDAVELDESQAIPELSAYDALWVMGGPMDVWEQEKHPWLATEKAVIRHWVLEQQKPYLGFCLGHQLLADALGGEVGPSLTPEIGILDVEVTTAGRQSLFLTGLPTTMKCLQWHSAEVKKAPANAAILVASDNCQIQAMSIGHYAFSIQYHIEITPTTVTEWGEIAEYKHALEKNLGPNALAQFDVDASANMADFNRYAKQLYDNWISVALTNR